MVLIMTDISAIGSKGLRTSMIDSKLSDLAILSIEKEIAQEIEDDNIIDEFAGSDKNRRIILI